MRLARCVAAALVILVLATVFGEVAVAGECDFCVCKGQDTVNSCTKCCSTAQKVEPAITKLELRVSDDGKAIVDQHGQEIARFVEGMRIQLPTTKGQHQTLQGCMRCRNECLIYEGERCVKWIRTCEWDFDCKTSAATRAPHEPDPLPPEEKPLPPKPTMPAPPPRPEPKPLPAPSATDKPASVLPLRQDAAQALVS